MVDCVVKIELLLTTQLVTLFSDKGAVTVTVTIVPGLAVDRSAGEIATVAPLTPRLVKVARQRVKASSALTARDRAVVGRVARRTVS
jgi:hypothetical protein